MNALRFLIPLLVIVVIFFQSCRNDDNEPAPIDPGYDYFPLEVGKYIEYDVDSTIYTRTLVGYDFEVEVRNNSIQVREEITDSFLDSEGHTVYNIERFERGDENQEWELRNTWTTLVTDQQAERTEENDRRFIKMIFPVSEDTDAWDGNQHFDINPEWWEIFIFKNWRYEYGEIGAPIEINGLNFDDVVTVYQADEENFIELRRSFERYARGVGLIEREILILDTQCIADCVGETWEEKAEKGFIVRQKIRDYN